MADRIRTQIEFLVALQDLDLMRKEIADVRELGFDVTGENALATARDELIAKIQKPLLSNYERLRARYKRAIVPVKGDTCLGCFCRLPTSLITHGRSDMEVLSCENCGRILYWLD